MIFGDFTERINRAPGEFIPVLTPRGQCVIWQCDEVTDGGLECAAHRGEIRAPMSVLPKSISGLKKYHQRAQDPAYRAAEAARKRESRRRKREAA